MAHVSDCRNSITFIFHIKYTQLVKMSIGILEDRKVKHGILMQTHLKYFRCLGKEIGKGKHFYYIQTRKNLYFISTSQFCIL